MSQLQPPAIQTQGTLTSKIRQCWNWIGHILHGERSSDCMVALGRRPEGERAVDRPETTWRRTVEVARWNDWSTTRAVARDRMASKQNVAALCAYWREEIRDDDDMPKIICREFT